MADLFVLCHPQTPTQVRRQNLLMRQPHASLPTFALNFPQPSCPPQDSIHRSCRLHLDNRIYCPSRSTQCLTIRDLAQTALFSAMLTLLNPRQCLRRLQDRRLCHHLIRSKCRGHFRRPRSILSTTHPTSSPKHIPCHLPVMRRRNLGILNSGDSIPCSSLHRSHRTCILNIAILRKSRSNLWSRHNLTCRLHSHARLRLDLRMPKL